ncbi:elks delta-like protein [Trypanosoma grayi]|uniref:elks delta-like protein n=1 Tax=Trypanosoma grayi TaxID=71804 RepID=UPI0004F48F45|nr:elks delta-like protein [Trypanosoma grayi]KEG13150.1 elks delta-like protein [Trypanosoma grayi]
MAPLSLSVAEAENAIEESEEELRVVQEQLEDAVRDNRIAYTERQRVQKTSDNHLQREEYIGELSEADTGLKETMNQVDSLMDQVEALNETPQDVYSRRKLTLVSLISMLDDLHASLSRSVQRVSHEEDARARDVLKAIRELSRERERAFRYCFRKKRQIVGVINMKKQRTKELNLESQKNISVLRASQEMSTLSVVEKIQTERKALQNELESIRNANQRLWDALRDTKYSSDTVQSGEHKREAALSANDALHGYAAVDDEKDYLREQLKLFDAKKKKLRMMTEELRASMNVDAEKNALKLKDLKREVHFQQQESHRLEGENQKLKSLCDSLAAAL